MTLARLLASARAGLLAVAGGLGGAFVLVAIASLSYRPRGHVGSAPDWLRIAVYATAMAVGAPLRLTSAADHGQLRLVPLTVTAVLLVVAYRLGRRLDPPGILVSAATAGLAIWLPAWAASSRLTSYGKHLSVRVSVPPWPSAAGMAVAVGLAMLVGSRGLRGAWGRTVAGALTGLMVVGSVAAATAIAVDAVRFRSTLGFAPGLLGDGVAWLGGFSLGGRLEADLSSPIPFLSGDLGAGLVSGGAWPAAYALVVVPLAAAVVAGRRQRPQLDRAWPEFGRAALVNALLWLVLAEASRLRFSGRLGEEALSGSAGLDAVSTVFVAALWGGVSAVVGLALPVRRR